VAGVKRKKMSAAEKQKRREKRAARRSSRVEGRDSARATRQRQGKVDRGAETFATDLMGSIEAESKPRQKALDKEAIKKRKRREKQRKRGEWS
jgi:hypothetical protein